MAVSGETAEQSSHFLSHHLFLELFLGGVRQLLYDWSETLTPLIHVVALPLGPRPSTANGVSAGDVLAVGVACEGSSAVEYENGQ